MYSRANDRYYTQLLYKFVCKKEIIFIGNYEIPLLAENESYIEDQMVNHLLLDGSLQFVEIREMSKMIRKFGDQNNFKENGQKSKIEDAYNTNLNFHKRSFTCYPEKKLKLWEFSAASSTGEYHIILRHFLINEVSGNNNISPYLLPLITIKNINNYENFKTEGEYYNFIINYHRERKHLRNRIFNQDIYSNQINNNPDLLKKMKEFENISQEEINRYDLENYLQNYINTNKKNNLLTPIPKKDNNQQLTPYNKIEKNNKNKNKINDNDKNINKNDENDKKSKKKKNQSKNCNITTSTSNQPQVNSPFIQQAQQTFQLYENQNQQQYHQLYNQNFQQNFTHHQKQNQLQNQFHLQLHQETQQQTNQPQNQYLNQNQFLQHNQIPILPSPSFSPKNRKMSFNSSSTSPISPNTPPNNEGIVSVPTSVDDPFENSSPNNIKSKTNNLNAQITSNLSLLNNQNNYSSFINIENNTDNYINNINSGTNINISTYLFGNTFNNDTTQLTLKNQSNNQLPINNPNFNLQTLQNNNKNHISHFNNRNLNNFSSGLNYYNLETQNNNYSFIQNNKNNNNNNDNNNNDNLSFNFNQFSNFNQHLIPGTNISQEPFNSLQRSPQSNINPITTTTTTNTDILSPKRKENENQIIEYSFKKKSKK